jgi:flagellar biosynthetic protein FlhB
MMADLERADVVVVNPTHVAVALRYEPAKGAPRVVAKGQGLIANRIREKATEFRIPMVLDVPLARALYKNCDLGDEIPAEFFGAVARVLAFVMMMKAKGSAAGLHTNVQGLVS